MKHCVGLLILLGVILLPWEMVAKTYDLIIRQGRVIDGTGNPAFFADVAVEKGRIASIGRIRDAARTEIDATGLIVAPGFIDVHTHADDIARNPRAENFVRMGVTTVVGGNCGNSALDVARLFRAVERTNVAVNFATLVGHNSIREKAMRGSFDRPPTPEEMRRMKALVTQAMKDGAVGLSTGLIYHPGVFATTDEIVELAKAITPFDGIYTSHMRYEDTHIRKALDEVFRVAREAGVRAEVSHIKLSGPTAWGQADQILAYIEKARAEGLDVTQDQYSYTASSTGLSQLIPDWAREGGAEQFRKRLADPVQKQRMLAEMKQSMRDKGREDLSYAVIASCRSDKSLDGLNVAEAAKARRGSDSLEHQFETVLEIQASGGASGVFHGMSEDDIKTFMRHPNTMIACDSGLRKLGEGVPHPRGRLVWPLRDSVVRMDMLLASDWEPADIETFSAAWNS